MELLNMKHKKPIHGVPWRQPSKGPKKTIFVQTAKDFVVIPTKGRGKGGQARNKRETACIVQHPASGAEGYSEAGRSFLDNRASAFLACVESREFKTWHNLKVDAYDGQIEIEESDKSGNITKRKLRMDEV